MKRTLALRIFALCILTLYILAPLAARADDAPLLWKTSLRIFTTRFETYWPTPRAKEPQYLTTSWMPRFSFTVQGPLAGGSKITVQFTKPDGSAWLNLPCDTPEIAAGDTAKFVSPSEQTNDKRAIRETGVFGFTIKLTNELTQTKAVLYSGKFNVSKFHIGSVEPKFKNVFEYFVEHDWMLPIGYLFVNDTPDEEAPPVVAVMWFRGDMDTPNIAAYVFYKGKQVASTKTDGGISHPVDVGTPGMLPDPKWQRWHFSFSNIRSTNKMTSANRYPDTMIFLDKNPGMYEIKVLRDGKLARTATFTVGADGKIVDNGLAQKNKLGTPWMMLPVKVMPGMDGKANITNYRASAFYANPVVGFPDP